MLSFSFWLFWFSTLLLKQKKNILRSYQLELMLLQAITFVKLYLKYYLWSPCFHNHYFRTDIINFIFFFCHFARCLLYQINVYDSNLHIKIKKEKKHRVCRHHAKILFFLSSILCFCWRYFFLVCLCLCIAMVTVPNLLAISFRGWATPFIVPRWANMIRNTHRSSIFFVLSSLTRKSCYYESWKRVLPHLLRTHTPSFKKMINIKWQYTNHALFISESITQRS